MFISRFNNRIECENSFLLRLAPSVKILGFALAIASALLVNKWPGLVLVSCYILLIARLAGLKLRHCITSLYRFAWMLIFAFAINLIFPSSETVESFSIEAMNRGFYFSIRLAVIVLCALTLTQVISPSDVSEALMVFGRVRGRLGLMLADLATTITLALRFAPILLEDAEKIKAAQILRGRRIKGLRGRIGFTVDLIVPLIDSALRRSESLGYALEAKGYGVRIPTATSVGIGKWDILILALSIGMIIVIISSKAL
ncbi:MAG: energy-coupling factor transporter transmembrane component T family protein [bacterium]